MAIAKEVPLVEELPEITISGGSSLREIESLPDVSFSLQPQEATRYSRGHYGQYGMYNDLPILNATVLDSRMGGSNVISDFSHGRGNLTADLGWSANSFSNRIARGAAAYDLVATPVYDENTGQFTTQYPELQKMEQIASIVGASVDKADFEVKEVPVTTTDEYGNEVPVMDYNEWGSPTPRVRQISADEQYQEALYKAIDEAAKDTYVVTMDSIVPGAASEGGPNSFQTAIYKRQGDALVAVTDPKSHGGYQNLDVYTGGSGFNFGKDVLPGLVFVGAFAAGAYGLDTLLTAAAASSAAGAGAGAGAAGTGAGITAAEASAAATYTAATPGFIGPSASLVGGANIAAADWAATSYALTQAATSFGMGALKGAALSAGIDLLSGRDIDLKRAGMAALTSGAGAAAGNYASNFAGQYGSFASKAAGSIAGGLAGGTTQAVLKGKDVAQGALYGALSGATSIPTSGISSPFAKIAADTAIGGTKAVVKGGDFTEGAIAAGTGSAVSSGVNTATNYGRDLYQSVTAPSYEYGLKVPPSNLTFGSDLSSTLSAGTSGFSIKPPTEGYSFGELSPTLPDNYYSPLYDLSNSKVVDKLVGLGKSTASSLITNAILGPSQTSTKTLVRQPRKSSTGSSSFYTPGSSEPDFSGDTDVGRVTSDLGASSYELRRFVSIKTGASTYIAFKDNKPQAPIPPGYKQVEVVGAAKGGLIKKPSKKAKGVVQSKNALAAVKEDKLPTTRKGLAVK